MAEPKRYQYALKAEECKLFRELRLLQKRSTESLVVPDHLKSQNLDISIHTGSRHLGHFEISAGLGVGIIQEFACVGVDSLQKLLDSKNDQEADSTAADVTEKDDDQDSVLGSNAPLERIDVVNQKSKAKAELGEPMPFVQIVALTIGKEHVTKSTLVESLREQFPRATITIDNPKSEESGNKSEIATREEIGQLKITPHSTGKSETSNLETGSSDISRQDPISHLGDLARYATEEPTDVEIGCKRPVGEVWSVLSYSRKLEIAHARAIQGPYGRAMDSGACTHCRKLGWDCRVYQTELVNLSHMDFGYSCQNCRISQTTCDLPSAISPSHQHVPVTPKLRLKINKNSPATSELLINDTPSATAASKPSLTLRMTREHVAKAGTTSHAHEDEDAIFGGSQGTVIISEEQRRIISSSKDMKILNVAAKIGLQLPDRVPNVIFNMYNQWQLHGEVKPPHKRPLQLQHYYSNLVSLYILAYAKMEMDLCYATLLRFQATNYQSANNTDLPDVETAVCAFQYLRWDTPLCRWIAILYAFLWGTEIAGDYAAFMKDNPHLDRSALTKLLYSVAYIRDPLTMGHDNAVLARWCDVHDHGKGSKWKSQLCEQMQSAIKTSADSRQEMEDARSLEEAQKIIERLGGHHAQNKSATSSPTSSFGKGKRKANEPLTHSYKKYKKGGGYSTGW